MNVSGLNNFPVFLGPQAGGNASQGQGGESSFGDLLGLATAPASTSAPTPAAAGQVTAYNNNQASALPTGDTSAQALPGYPGAPALDATPIGDRLLNLPPQPIFSQAVAKVQTKAGDVEQVVDALTRRVVWNDFLRKMKEELGVTAEDVLNAFTSLSEEDLAKPPTQTVDKVVMALGLSDQQAQLAKQYFLQLIDRTQPKSLGEELKNSEKQISLTLMSQRELTRRNIDRNIDHMNQNFFMNSAPRTLVSEGPRAASPEMNQGREVEFDSSKPQLDPQLSAGLNQIVEKMQAVKNNEPPSADVEALLKNFTAPQAQAPTQARAQAQVQPQNEFASQLMNQAEAATPAPELDIPEVRDLASDGGKPFEAVADQLVSVAPKFTGGREEEHDFTRDASFLGAAWNPESQTVSERPMTSEFATQLQNQSPMEVTVPDLVQNARVMVHSGGGEMKVTLKPEGLGEVAMRVSVDQGKVNVQMITESDEAKKLIERELGELKTQLAGNQLQVESIKIDTATNLGKQLEQQYQDAQRQLAQQTLEQFRQDHQGWRRSFFEVPGARVYKSQSDAHRDISAPSTPTRRASSRRLDLVA